MNHLRFAETILKRRRLPSAILPVKEKVYHFVNDLLQLLFIHYSGKFSYFNAEEIQGKLALLQRDLTLILQPMHKNLENQPEKISQDFFNHLPEIYDKLWEDAETINSGDPASESLNEVISAYPGFFAIYTYRMAHEFYQMKVPIFPRIISEFAHHRTGIDIHPGATIGDRFFIDHGTGIVIGESTVIGNNVKIYQGVSLGALSVSKALATTKRHPTIEDNVVIYANATILGGKTLIGHDSVIGGNVWLTESVPPNSIVYHKSEVTVSSKKAGKEPTNFSI